MMLKKTVFLLLGFVATGLGFLGVLLPGVPATPFALLACYAFSMSSPRFQNWLLYRSSLGPFIRRIRENKGLSWKEKRNILLFVWVSIGVTILFFMHITWLRIFLLILLLLKTWFIIRYKTLRSGDI